MTNIREIFAEKIFKIPSCHRLIPGKIQSNNTPHQRLIYDTICDTIYSTIYDVCVKKDHSNIDAEG